MPLQEDIAKARAGGATNAQLQDWIQHPDTIAKYPELQEYFADKNSVQAPEERTWARYGQHVGAMLGGNAVEGVTGMLGFPGTVSDAVGKAGSNYIVKPILDKLMPPSAEVLQARTARESQPGPLSIGQLNQGTQALGLTGQPLQQPEGMGENIASAVMRTVPQTVLSAGLGAPLAATAVGNASAGVAADAAHKLAPDSWLLPLLAGGVGGLAGSAIGGAKIAGTEAASAAAAKSAQEEALLAKESALRAAPHEVRAIAAKTGESTDFESAGLHAQDQARDWLNNTLPEKLGNLWNPINEGMKGAETPLSNFFSATKDINKNAGLAGPIANIFTPSAPSQIASTLRRYTAGDKGIAEVSPSTKELPIYDASKTPLKVDVPGTPAKPFTWENVQDLRSALGDAMGNRQVLNSVGEKNLQRLYAALSKDMESSAENQGMGDAFRNANEQSTNLYNVAAGPMSKIVASGKKNIAEDPLPGKVADKLVSGSKNDSTDLAALREHISSAVDEIAAAHLNENPQIWNKLSEQNKQALIPDVGDRGELDRIGQLTAPDKELGALELARTQKALAETRKPPVQDEKGLRQLVGESFGKVGGMAGGWLLGHALGDTGIGGGLAHGMEGLGALGGLMAPQIGSAIGRVKTSPELWNYPLSGAATGAATEGTK